MSDQMVKRFKELTEEIGEAKEFGEDELVEHLQENRDRLYLSMSQNERDYVDGWLKEGWGATILLIGVFLVALAIIALLLPSKPANAAPAFDMPPCDETQPQPPLVVRRATGESIPAVRVIYNTADRTIDLIETPRIFCSGVES